MRAPEESRAHLQKLLDQTMKLKGVIAQIDNEIVKFQNSLLGTGWSEGNIKIGWRKGDCFSEPISTQLMNRDRIFSLSSITSRISTHAPPIQNQKINPTDGARFYKKKKKHIKKRSESQSKKGKEKIIHRRGRLLKRKVA